jgi:hypothetical protein
MLKRFIGILPESIILPRREGVRSRFLQKGSHSNIQTSAGVSSYARQQEFI